VCCVASNGTTAPRSGSVRRRRASTIGQANLAVSDAKENPVMSTKSERNELAKARARSLGAKLFAEKGYRETTTRELSAAMEVTNGTFYYYFSSKEDLLYEISRDALVEITAAVNDALDGVEDRETRIKKMIAAHMTTILSSPDSHKTALEMNWRSLTDDKRQEIVEARADYEALFRSEIQSAQASGALRRNVQARTLTLLLLNMMNWTIFWYRAGRDLAIDDLIVEVQALFLDGSRGSS
jgi:TetR/AcrR family transcriptional regulator, cholesterol catabolism regulator